MWADLENKVDAGFLGPMAPEEVLSYYDGPRTFSFTSGAESVFIAHVCDELEGVERLLVAECNKESIDHLRDGSMALRDVLITACPLYVVDRDYGANILNAWAVELGELPQDALPYPGVTLNPESVIVSAATERVLLGIQKLRLVSRTDNLPDLLSSGSVLTAIGDLFERLFENLYGLQPILNLLIAKPGSLMIENEVLCDISGTRPDLSLLKERLTQPLAADAKHWRTLLSVLAEHDLDLYVALSAENTSVNEIVLDKKGQESIARQMKKALQERPAMADVSLNSDDIPQADSLERLFLLVDVIASGLPVDSPSLGDVSPRQILYYKAAARILGWMEDDFLTPAGRQISRLAQDERLKVFAVHFESTALATAWIQWSDGQTLLDVVPGTARQFLLEKVHSLSAVTAGRRASTLESWLAAAKKNHYDVQG